MQANACHNSLRCPVTASRADLGAGPIASTVCEPAGICVRPASCTMYVMKPCCCAAPASRRCGGRGCGCVDQSWYGYVVVWICRVVVVMWCVLVYIETDGVVVMWLYRYRLIVWVSMCRCGVCTLNMQAIATHTHTHTATHIHTPYIWDTIYTHNIYPPTTTPTISATSGTRSAIFACP